MLSKTQIKSKARGLLRLSLNKEGAVDIERVRAILAVLKKTPHPQTASILRAYKPMVAAMLANHTLEIEHAGTIPPELEEKLSSLMKTRYHRTLQTSFKSNPALIAGFRIRVGDDLYDASADARLRQLESTFGKIHQF